MFAHPAKSNSDGRRRIGLVSSDPAFIIVQNANTVDTNGVRETSGTDELGKEKEVKEAESDEI